MRAISTCDSIESIAQTPKVSAKVKSQMLKLQP